MRSSTNHEKIRKKSSHIRHSTSHIPKMTKNHKAFPSDMARDFDTQLDLIIGSKSRKGTNELSSQRTNVLRSTLPRNRSLGTRRSSHPHQTAFFHSGNNSHAGIESLRKVNPSQSNVVIGNQAITPTAPPDQDYYTGTEDKSHWSSHSFSSTHPEQNLTRTRRTYWTPEPSRFCHVCSQKPRKNRRYAVCSLMSRGHCRKIVCERCIELEGWDFDFIRRNAETWLCPHCAGICPRRSQCHVYARVNAQRKKNGGKRRCGLDAESSPKRSARD